MFKVKLVGEENPAYLQGANLADALQRTDFGVKDLDTVVEIDDKAIFNKLLHDYVVFNSFLESEGATPVTLAVATSLGLTQNSTMAEIEEMAKKRALDERLGQGTFYDGVWDDNDDQICSDDDDSDDDDDDDSDDDDDWEGEDLISLIGK
jgi:hypothetical protein